MLIALLASAAVSSAHADALCTPNYQVTREACIQGAQTGVEPRVANDVRVNEGACEVPDPDAICREAGNRTKFAMSLPGVAPDSVGVIHGYTVKAEGKRCGDLLNSKPKVDVYCNYTYSAPVYERHTDVSCPIVGADDTNGCFAADPATVAPTAIRGCMSAQPQQIEELWTQTACLMDIYQAVNDPRQRLAPGVLGFKGVDGLNQMLHHIYYEQQFPEINQFIDQRIPN